MKTKHFYSFDKEINKKMKSDRLDMAGWEALRIDSRKGDFSIEKTRQDYVQNCEGREDYWEVAKIISDIICTHDWNKIVSVGVGKGILEYHIKKMIPEVSIECTDYTQNSLEILKKVLTECSNFRLFDMLNDDWISFKEMDVIILCRLSTEFSVEQWNTIFERMYVAGIKNIIYMPTELLNLKILVKEKIHFLLNFIRGRKNIFCGWMYSEKQQRKFFSGNSTPQFYLINNTYRLDDNAIFELKRNG